MYMCMFDNYYFYYNHVNNLDILESQGYSFESFPTDVKVSPAYPNLLDSLLSMLSGHQVSASGTPALKGSLRK